MKTNILLVLLILVGMIPVAMGHPVSEAGDVSRWCPEAPGEMECPYSDTWSVPFFPNAGVLRLMRPSGSFCEMFSPSLPL